MKVLSNTLELCIETWDDPGDYPSGAGAGPLPSYDYVAGVDGSLRVELEESDIQGLHKTLFEDYILETVDPELWLDHVKVTKWNMVRVPVEGKQVYDLTAEDIDSSSWEPPSGPEEEYNPEDDYDYNEERG